MFQILHVCPKPRGELTGTEAILTASGTSAGVGLAIPVSQPNMTVESFGSRMKQMSLLVLCCIWFCSWCLRYSRLQVDTVKKNVELILKQGFVSRGFLGITFVACRSETPKTADA